MYDTVSLDPKNGYALYMYPSYAKNWPLCHTQTSIRHTAEQDLSM